MGKIVQERFPNLSDTDQEAVRQHAVAALNIVQQGKRKAIESGSITSQTSPEDKNSNANTSLIDDVKKFVLSVTDLDIDLIDRINPFGEAYAVLAKTMTEERLRQVAEIIASKRVNLSIEEARELSKRALRFKREKNRLPSLTSTDPWERRLAEGIAFLQRKVKDAM